MNVHATDLVELLDARDKIIAEQRAVIAELSNEPITEFETLRQAHDAQNAVLARMQARVRMYRVIIKGLCGRLCDFRKFSNIILDMKQAELVALRAENAELRAQLDNALTRLGIDEI